MLQMTLIRNQSDPRRYVRYVRYERKGNRVVPLGDTVTAIRELKWSQIGRGDRTDPAFEREWREHLARQETLGETVAEHNERAWAKYVRSLPASKRRWSAC